MKHTRILFIVLVTVVAMLATMPVAARVDPGDQARSVLATEDATGCVDSDNATGPGQSIGTSSGTHWAGVIHVNIPPNSAPEIPTFCTDLTTSISSGACFQTAGATACPITWLLNNGYGPSDSLINTEAAARQAAVWFYSDGMTVNTGDPVYARTQTIIAAVPSPCVLPAGPPEMEIDPPSAVNFLPGGETHEFTVIVTQNDDPVADQVVNLQTDFGTLNTAQVTTGSDGRATFSITSNNVGTAHITASFSYVLPAGTRFTKLPGAADQQVIVLGTPQTGDVIASATKTWEEGTVIVVHKFRDDNTNGVQDSGEESLSGWTMRLYRQDGSSWVQVGSNKSTNSSGNAVWNNLAAGTYRAQETLQAGWYATTANPSDSVVLAAGQQAQINFGNVPLAVIRAWKFHDLNLDGLKDADEPTLDGWTMNIDPAVNGIGSGVTSGGFVNFVDLDPNTYTVWETMQPGWMATTPDLQTLTVAANDYEEIWFGNAQVDLGDLPAPYALTRVVSDGARHRLGDLYLGHFIDAEQDGQCSGVCGGDDDNAPVPGGPDDEDGVEKVGTWEIGTVAGGKGGAVEVTVTGGNGYLNAWIDWNGDLDFADDGEQIFIDQPVAGDADGEMQTLTFDIPGIAAGHSDFYARFRLYEQAQGMAAMGRAQANVAALTGVAINGEVEDYLWETEPLSVVLSSFEVTCHDDYPLLTWETVSELTNAGFNLYRNTTPGAPGQQLNATLIPSESPGSSQGFTYSWHDTSALPNTQYFYWLEDVSLAGVATLHGPVDVMCAAPTAVEVLDLTVSSPVLPVAPATVPVGAVAAAAVLALAAARRRRAG